MCHPVWRRWLVRWGVRNLSILPVALLVVAACRPAPRSRAPAPIENSAAPAEAAPVEPTISVQEQIAVMSAARDQRPMCGGFGIKFGTMPTSKPCVARDALERVAVAGASGFPTAAAGAELDSLENIVEDCHELTAATGMAAPAQAFLPVHLTWLEGTPSPHAEVTVDGAPMLEACLQHVYRAGVAEMMSFTEAPMPLAIPKGATLRMTLRVR